jgi:hypothetical protein
MRYFGCGRFLVGCVRATNQISKVENRIRKSLDHLILIAFRITRCSRSTASKAIEGVMMPKKFFKWTRHLLEYCLYLESNGFHVHWCRFGTVVAMSTPRCALKISGLSLEQRPETCTHIQTRHYHLSCRPSRIFRCDDWL